MIKQIGNIKLNYSFYSGKDQYSDGNVEDELLEIVKSTTDYNSIIAHDERWPILYHLSPYRSNIIEWYPFSKQDSILEIGAGCGAITGSLSDKVGRVTCVELSEKRSLINAYRNKEKSNIEILIGDFNSMKFEEKYDYITLIGVLEYAPSFSKTDQPFTELLTNVKKLLKPGGQLFIAIENKFGLKYWAGAREDHTGKLFDSIENYQDVNNVRTFSKKELANLLYESNFEKVKYYYPMPDYKFPFQIFSDETLPGIGELRDLIHNYDRNRAFLFNEAIVYDSLIENDQFSFFANSFLVVCE